MYYIQHCFICRPSDSTVPTDAGIIKCTQNTGMIKITHGVQCHYSNNTYCLPAFTSAPPPPALVRMLCIFLTPKSESLEGKEAEEPGCHTGLCCHLGLAWLPLHLHNVLSPNEAEG